jgi:hypothetical protein
MLILDSCVKNVDPRFKFDSDNSSLCALLAINYEDIDINVVNLALKCYLENQQCPPCLKTNENHHKCFVGMQVY